MNRWTYLVRVRVGLQSRLRTREAAEITQEIKEMLNDEYSDMAMGEVIKQLGEPDQVVREYSDGKSKNQLISFAKLVLAMYMGFYSMIWMFNALISADYQVMNYLFMLISCLALWLFMDLDLHKDEMKGAYSKLWKTYMVISGIVGLFTGLFYLMIAAYNSNRIVEATWFGYIYFPYNLVLLLFFGIYTLLTITTLTLFWIKGVNYLSRMMIANGAMFTVLSLFAGLNEAISEPVTGILMLLTSLVPMLLGYVFVRLLSMLSNKKDKLWMHN